MRTVPSLFQYLLPFGLLLYCLVPGSSHFKFCLWQFHLFNDGNCLLSVPFQKMDPTFWNCVNWSFFQGSHWVCFMCLASVESVAAICWLAKWMLSTIEFTLWWHTVTCPCLHLFHLFPFESYKKMHFLIYSMPLLDWMVLLDSSDKLGLSFSFLCWCMVCVLLLTLCLHQHFLSFPSISYMFQLPFKIGAITCVIPSNCTSEYESGPSFFHFVICGPCTDTHIIYPPTFCFLPFLLQFDFHLK